MYFRTRRLLYHIGYQVPQRMSIPPLLANHVHNHSCPVNLSIFCVVARSGVRPPACGGPRSARAGRANSVGEPALPGLKGLGFCLASPQPHKDCPSHNGCQ